MSETMKGKQIALDGGEVAEPEDPEPEDPDAEERPDIDPGDMADIDDIDPADVHADTSDADTSAETPTETPDGFGSMGEMSVGGGDEMTVGEMYARALCVFANQIAKTHGSGEAPFETADGDIDLALARQLGIIEYANQTMAKRSTETLSPERALVMSTAMFALAVVTSDPELFGNMTESIKKNTKNLK